jgi:hypothetical protein
MADWWGESLPRHRLGGGGLPNGLGGFVRDLMRLEES